jgi:hypothetical protein
MEKIISKRYPCWDGKTNMKVIYDDGGREAAGFKGDTGDCVVRAIAIATKSPYREIYNDLYELNNRYAQGRRSRVAKHMQHNGNSSPRKGNFKEVYHQYILDRGFDWVPLMKIGSGCTANLCEEDLPSGILICRLSRHLCAVIDKVVYDTQDSQRHRIVVEHGNKRIMRRCVYGYYIKAERKQDENQDKSR